MAKRSGLGQNFYAGGYDLSGDVGSLTEVGGGPALGVVTAIDKSAVERIPYHRDGRMGYNCWFNPASNQAHDRLSTLPTADVDTMYATGTTLGDPAAALRGKQIDYNPTRGADGSLAFQIMNRGNAYALEWGRLATGGKLGISGAGAVTAVDGGASSAHGLQAYLQVFAFTGTDATIFLQESSDNASSDAFANITGGGFTQVTVGPGTQRIATAAGLTVERYVRVNVSTSGGFSALTFAVMFNRNEVAFAA